MTATYLASRCDRLLAPYASAREWHGPLTQGQHRDIDAARHASERLIDAMASDESTPVAVTQDYETTRRTLRAA